MLCCIALGEQPCDNSMEARGSNVTPIIPVSNGAKAGLLTLGASQGSCLKAKLRNIQSGVMTLTFLIAFSFYFEFIFISSLRSYTMCLVVFISL